MSDKAPLTGETREWNATSYDRISDPQFAWGKKVLERLLARGLLRGDEHVLDAGCGTGRLTELLLERVPGATVTALDHSSNMLGLAGERLGRFGARARTQQVDLQTWHDDGKADVIFSTATFHWVKDHPRLFQNLLRTLRPGGLLFAQCGGAGNLARFHARAHEAFAREPYAPYFTGLSDPWEFARAEVTADRLEAVGFVEVEASLEDAPTRLPDAATYAEFIRSVILRSYLVRLPTAELRDRLVDEMTEASAADPEPFSLDYVRLNLSGRRVG
jgi:trans-aconitate 2-methyltransferase